MTLVQKFRQKAMILSNTCYCGQYKESSRRYEPGVIWLIYDSTPGAHGKYPISKHCHHRQIERELIFAYKRGRNDSKRA